MNFKLHWAAGLLAPLCLSGCGPSPSLGVVNTSQVAPRLMQEANEVIVYEVVPDGARIVAEIDATSCKNKLWDPDPSQSNAIDQMKVKAAALGANGIAAITFNDAGTSFMSNCWSSITAQGTAFRVVR